MLKENFETAIADAHRRLDNLLQRANLAGLQSSGQNYPGELLKEAIGEILISLEETQVLAEELQQQNEELLNQLSVISYQSIRHKVWRNSAPTPSTFKVWCFALDLTDNCLLITVNC